MTEFTNGIFKTIAGTSAGRALVYTLGHIIIAMSVVTIITGANLWEAGADGEANYLNVGAFLRVGDEFRIRIFLQVDGKPHGDGAVVFTAKDNNGNDVQKKHLSKIVEFVATIV